MCVQVSAQFALAVTKSKIKLSSSTNWGSNTFCFVVKPQARALIRFLSTSTFDSSGSGEPVLAQKPTCGPIQGTGESSSGNCVCEGELRLRRTLFCLQSHHGTETGYVKRMMFKMWIVALGWWLTLLLQQVPQDVWFWELAFANARLEHGNQSRSPSHAQMPGEIASRFVSGPRG